VFFLLYNNFIPISLYVTIELVNVGQAFLIQSDENLYRKELDVACIVRSSNLVQELGMVSNVFSDKTGTLTRNEMNLVKFVINGTLYDIEKAPESEVADKLSAQSYMQRFGSEQQGFYDFFRCLITCHTVVREKNGTYRAESPDELALVEGAGQYRCQLYERGSKEMEVSIFGERLTYEVLAVNPFNADRKRMSVLLREVATDKYFVMCKGADNIMYPLCTMSLAGRNRVDANLLDLANMGLRTLIVAHRELTKEEAMEWLAGYKAATLATVNREERIADEGAKLELNMKLLGITAIEDRLQDEVPEVIADMTKAGIIVWMLTGDKLETAINIGRSCNLVLPDTHLHMLSRIDTPQMFARRLREEYDAITKVPTNPNAALVLDGPSFLHFDEEDLDQRAMLLRIGAGSRSVIACRLTPTQKRELVKLVKVDTVPAATTLSIGDGANDVSMILEANVGVGIFGKEGRQAANNADFAIGEFKFLRRLLLVHGRWNYVRQAKVFLYCMHKNMVLTLTLFWFRCV
jgi:phospholipid-translocating P-type ATPase (flippase)